jgi:hypothetical protein
VTIVKMGGLISWPNAGVMAVDSTRAEPDLLAVDSETVVR